MQRPTTRSAELEGLVMRMLDPNPETRIKLEEILKLDFLN